MVWKSIKISGNLKLKLDSIKGKRSYSTVIEETVFKRMDKLDIILKNEKAIKELIKKMGTIAEVVGKKSSDYVFDPEEWVVEVIERKREENTVRAVEEQNVEYTDFVTADKIKEKKKNEFKS